MKNIIGVAALIGALTVILGAFGAHSLQDKIGTHGLKIYQTGISYQFYHVLALFMTGLLKQHNPSVWLSRAAVFFTLGILLFSGSLYLLATRDLLSLQGLTWLLGPATPIGGVCFIIGWTSLFVHTITVNKTT